MKQYFLHFIHTDDGIETIEWIGLIVVAAALIAIVANVGTTLINTARQYETEIENSLPDPGW